MVLLPSPSENILHALIQGNVRQTVSQLEELSYCQGAEDRRDII
jgi:hypothetical protein